MGELWVRERPLEGECVKLRGGGSERDEATKTRLVALV